MSIEEWYELNKKAFSKAKVGEPCPCGKGALYEECCKDWWEKLRSSAGEDDLELYVEGLQAHLNKALDADHKTLGIAVYATIFHLNFIKHVLSAYANKDNWTFVDGAWHPNAVLYNEDVRGPETPQDVPSEEFGPWLLAQAALEK